MYTVYNAYCKMYTRIRCAYNTLEYIHTHIHIPEYMYTALAHTMGWPHLGEV